MSTPTSPKLTSAPSSSKAMDVVATAPVADMDLSSVTVDNGDIITSDTPTDIIVYTPQSPAHSHLSNGKQKDGKNTIALKDLLFPEDTNKGTQPVTLPVEPATPKHIPSLSPQESTVSQMTTKEKAVSRKRGAREIGDKGVAKPTIKKGSAAAAPTPITDFMNDGFDDESDSWDSLQAVTPKQQPKQRKTVTPSLKVKKGTARPGKRSYTPESDSDSEAENPRRKRARKGDFSAPGPIPKPKKKKDTSEVVKGSMEGGAVSEPERAFATPRPKKKKQAFDPVNHSDKEVAASPKHGEQAAASRQVELPTGVRDVEDAVPAHVSEPLEDDLYDFFNEPDEPEVESMPEPQLADLPKKRDPIIRQRVTTVTTVPKKPHHIQKGHDDGNIGGKKDPYVHQLEVADSQGSDSPPPRNRVTKTNKRRRDVGYEDDLVETEKRGAKRFRQDGCNGPKPKVNRLMKSMKATIDTAKAMGSYRNGYLSKPAQRQKVAHIPTMARDQAPDNEAAQKHVKKARVPPPKILKATMQFKKVEPEEIIGYDAENNPLYKIDPKIKHGTIPKSTRWVSLFNGNSLTLQNLLDRPYEYPHVSLWDDEDPDFYGIEIEDMSSEQVNTLIKTEKEQVKMRKKAEKQLERQREKGASRKVRSGRVTKSKRGN
ncbi:hypothetical protein K504DRAFT_452973 [Pleomassaria siparia CBS 279.74]|uniref:Uncharacterized protein n=1 Tax=Pleomassaria siparia CBS 279.74 TaxID=1314801 RepID=A0A6G1JRD9_9PLEO|nr:hypothetical protein K504DRAFT_452973 [Pleomassaria siparia CBS 279.74]